MSKNDFWSPLIWLGQIKRYGCSALQYVWNVYLSILPNVHSWTFVFFVFFKTSLSDWHYFASNHFCTWQFFFSSEFDALFDNEDCKTWIVCSTKPHIVCFESLLKILISPEEISKNSVVKISISHIKIKLFESIFKHHYSAVKVSVQLYSFTRSRHFSRLQTTI